MRFLSMVKQHLWFLIFPLAFLLYSNSFNNFSVIEQSVDVLADSDSANFIILIQDFNLSKKYGDEYNTKNRSLGDIAQKHKIHHILYVIVASLIYKIFSLIYHLLGIPSSQAMYSVNAFLSCFNLFFLYLLLKYFNLDYNKIALLLFLYAFSLSTWIYSSIPGSWTFSTTLILLFLVLFYKKKTNPFVLSIFIGISMLQNIFLVSLMMFLLIKYFLSSNTMKEFAKRGFSSVLITIATWIVSLNILSLFDDSLRIDNFIRYTIWFKDFIGYKYSFYDLYIWKVTISNLFINSMVSNQSNPGVPPEALLYTIKESSVGIVSTLTYITLFCLILVRIFKMFKSDFISKKGSKILEKEQYHLIGYCLVWVFVTLILHPPAAFLYSTTLVPLMVMLIHQFLKMENRYEKILLFTTLILLIINNASQILKFREALSILSS